MTTGEPSGHMSDNDMRHCYFSKIYIRTPPPLSRAPNLILNGSDERGVRGSGDIPMAILLLCQYMQDNALLLHTHDLSWVRQTGECRGPHTASFVFLKQYHEAYTPFSPQVKVIRIETNGIDVVLD